MNSVKSDKKICTDTLKLIADYWTLRIIEALSNQPLRFCELQREVGNVNPVTLTSKLHKLEQSKLITRNEGTDNKLSVSYSLTAKGNKALPIIIAINKFTT